MIRALVAEDDLVSSKLLTRLLSEYGECNAVKNGLEAVDAFHQAYAEGRPYDLICLDIKMPRMDGHEVLRCIRLLEDKKRIADDDKVKVIMITALSDRKNVMRAAFSRCEAYLVKPVGKENLSEKLRSLGFSTKEVAKSLE